MLVDPLHDRQDLIQLGEHPVLNQDEIALHFSNVTAHIADIASDFSNVPLDAPKTGLVPKQDLHHLAKLILNTPQIGERDVRDLARIGQIRIRFSHPGTI